MAKWRQTPFHQFAISTKMRRVKSAKSEKNKNFYRQFSSALINFDPPRHFAISTKKRRFTGNTEGLIKRPKRKMGNKREAIMMYDTDQETIKKLFYKQISELTRKTSSFDYQFSDQWTPHL